MKVIKDKDKTFTCGECGSIVELEYDYEVNWDSGYIYWECPVCGTRNYLRKDPLNKISLEIFWRFEKSAYICQCKQKPRRA